MLHVVALFASVVEVSSRSHTSSVGLSNLPPPVVHSPPRLVRRTRSNGQQQWGLLITFIELIKNPRYSFWSHSFTHCAPELERVFESVARSCMTPGAAAGAPADDAVATGQA